MTRNRKKEVCMDFSNCFVSECREYSSYVQHVKAPVFRKSFVLKEGSQSGEILICGLGFYDLLTERRLQRAIWLLIFPIRIILFIMIIMI